MKTFKIYESAKALPIAWDDLVCHDIFLQRKYLNAVSEASPPNIQWFYIGVFVNNHLVGVAIVQRVRLYLKDMFRNTKVSCIKEFIRSTVSRFLRGNILVVGNLMHTGQHGMYYSSRQIILSDFLNVVFQAVDDIKMVIKQTQGKTIRMVMCKDYFLDDTIHQENKVFVKQKMHTVFVQPNMIMPVSERWLSITDYVNDLNKKYRSRYRRAKKKLGNIVCSELDLEAIKKYETTLHNQYLNVSNNAKFNTFILPENHFYALKLNLKGDFRLFGYFLDDKLVGFYTLILNNTYLETYFLGYDAEHQYSNQLYLNMLYSMAEFAITHKFLFVVYARTAMEIKSSVGALSKPMMVYMKHTSNIINTILKPVFSLMRPDQDWEERHPFKTQKSP